MKVKFKDLIKKFPNHAYYIAIFYALFYLSIYVLLILLKPQGYEFIGGRNMDDGILLYFMKSFDNGFMDPWNYGMNIKTYLSPFFVSSSIYIPLGYISYFLRIPYHVTMFSVMAVFNFLFVLSVYKFSDLLFPKDDNRTFLKLFFLSSGIFGIIYFFVVILGGVRSFFESGSLIRTILFGANYEFFEGFGVIPITALDRLYNSIPLFFGFLFLILIISYIKNRKSYFFYFSMLSIMFCFSGNPIHGIGFIIIFLLYHFLLNSGETSTRFNIGNFIRIIGLIMIFSIIGIIPWILGVLKNPKVFELYSKEFVGRARLNYLILAGILGLPFVVIGLKKDLRRKSLFLLSILTISMVLIYEICQMIIRDTFFIRIPLTQNLALLLNYLSLFSIILALVLLILFIFFLFKNRKMFLLNRIDRVKLFFYSGILVFSLLPTLPAGVLFGFNTARFIHFWWFFWVGLVFFGIKGLSLNIASRIELRKIFVILIILLSSFSFLMYFYFSISFPRNDLYPAYVKTEEYNALEFLKGKNQGLVISSPEIGFFIPYISNKYSLLGSSPGIFNYDDKYEDYELFFSDKNYKSKLKIVNKYNIKYIFYGVLERKLNPGNSINFEDMGFLRKIFDMGKAQVYEVSY
ncbi:MAG: hypothetical protein M1371_00780 [Actinobacteria bacterium]|nr:hypothetical protein [Actinomycetota bacterium]